MSMELGMHCPVYVCNKQVLEPGDHVTDLSQMWSFASTKTTFGVSLCQRTRPHLCQVCVK